MMMMMMMMHPTKGFSSVISYSVLFRIQKLTWLVGVAVELSSLVGVAVEYLMGI